MTLDDFVLTARAAWPSWPGTDAEAFARFIEALVKNDASLGRELDKLHARDLWLAFHAGRGLAPAIAAIESTCFSDLTNILRARRAEPAQAEEAVQRLRDRLLVAAP